MIPLQKRRTQQDNEIKRALNSEKNAENVHYSRIYACASSVSVFSEMLHLTVNLSPQRMKLERRHWTSLNVSDTLTVKNW